MRWKRKPRERIDAEVARELLNRTNPRAGEIEGDRDARLFWKIQRKLLPVPWRGEGEPDASYASAAQRWTRMAELHAQCSSFPEDAAAQAEREKLLEEIAAEALRELEEEERHEQSA